MKTSPAICVLAFATALAACSKDPVTVRVLPEQYEVGELRSRLATPAVDATVGQSPSAVQIHVCPGTPPARIIQFETELAARYKGPVSLGLLDAAQCAS